MKIKRIARDGEEFFLVILTREELCDLRDTYGFRLFMMDLVDKSKNKPSDLTLSGRNYEFSREREIN